MTTEAQLERFLDVVTQENSSTLSIVRECMTSVNNLAGSVDELSKQNARTNEQALETQKEMVKVLTLQEAHKNNADLLFQSVIKTQESLAGAHSSLDVKVQSISEEVVELTTRASAIPQLFERVRDLEQHKNFVSGETKGQKEKAKDTKDTVFKVLPYLKSLGWTLFVVGMTVGYMKDLEKTSSRNTQHTEGK